MKTTSIVTPECGTCSFCAYLAGERPYTFVFRNDEVAIMVTREQRGNPHLLVIPIGHVETLLGVSDTQAAALAIATREAARAIEKAYQPQGLYIWQNNGTPASQTVAHVHFHVAGTLEKGGTEWGPVPELPLKATEEIASLLRPHFSL